MNGKQLSEQIRERNARIKVLFMTGYSRNAIVHHGRLDPGVELIQKAGDAGRSGGEGETRLRPVLGSQPGRKDPHRRS
jgi:hypothetical protein